MQLRKVLFLIASLTLLVSPVFAEPAEELFEEDNENIEVRLLSEYDVISPKDSSTALPAQIGILLKIAPGWHLYWRNSGESGLPTKVTWQLPEGWKTGPLKWPVPKKIRERGDIITFGYTDQVLVMADLHPPHVELLEKETYTISAEVRWLLCSNVCIPGKATVKRSISFGSKAQVKRSKDYPLFEKCRCAVPVPPKKESLPEAYSKFVVTGLLNKDAAAPGNTHTGALLLEETPFADLKQAASSVQLFPYESKTLAAGTPKISKLDNSSLPLGKQSFLITFPLSVSSSAESGKQELKGALALARESGLPCAVGWSIPVDVAADRGTLEESQGFSTLKQISGEPAELTYRFLSYEEIEAQQGQTKPAEQTTDSSNTSLLLALLFGFLGGILLNLMPCVLPIISIKVMGFVEASEQPRRQSLLAAGAFSAGILFSFLVLSGIVSALRAYGFSLGWGFQFQHPEFVLALIVIVFLLGLGFFDIYSFSLPGMQQANRAVGNVRSRTLKNFFDGILTTALSTPCTAPFLGTALVVAFTQSAAVTALVFVSIGVGLSLPYVLLATNPRLLRLLPAPGAWMIRMKQAMGFLLLATVLWLLFVLHRLTGPGALWTLTLLFLIYFFSWLIDWAKESVRGPRAALSVFAATLAIAFFLVRTYPKMIALQQTSASEAVEEISWKPYSKELISSLQAEGTPVFLDFTAAWCLTCKANELFVVETQQTRQALRKFGITPVKADWTSGDPEITEALNSYGAKGVPLYVVLPANPDQDPLVLPTILTPGILLDAFKEANIGKK